jgi:hypothetical protein
MNMTGAKNNVLKVVLTTTIALVISACGGSGGDPSPNETNAARKEMLTHYADEIIIPGYDAFSATFDDVVTASTTFTETPTEANLLELRNRWEESYLTWQTVEMFEFGPASDHTLRNFFNIYPADTVGIKAAITEPTTNLEVPASYTKQGFPALDYLINGLGSTNGNIPTDASIVALYSTAPNASARRTYLTRIITRMNTLLDEVVTEWDSYRDTFISKTGTDNLSSLSLIVNAYSLYYERFVRTGKIGIPSGATISSGGVAYPEKVEAFYKRNISVELALKAHETAFRFFNGTTSGASTGPSFAAYMTSQNVKDPDTGTLLSTIMNDQFEAIRTKLAPVGPTLYEAVLNDKEDVVEIHSLMQQLVAYIKVDMANTGLGVTITYIDNDGD